LGIVGHLSSATTQAAVPTYRAAKLAVSIPWTVGAIPDERTAGLVRAAADEADTLAYLDLLGLEQGFENIVTLTEPNLDAVSLETEAIKLASDGVTAGMIILALAEANYSLPLFGQVDVGSSQVTEVAKAAANGLIFVSPAPAPIDLPESTAFIEAYQSLAGFPPGPRAALAYDATHILLDSIEQVSLKNGSRPTRAEVSAAIPQVKRLGLTGNIAFNRLGQRLEAPVWIYQIVDQQYPGQLIVP